MPLNTSHLVFVFSFPFFFFNIGRCWKVFTQSKLFYFVLLLICIKTFAIFTASVNNLDPDYYGLLQLCVELPVCVTSFMVLLKRFSYKSDDLITLLIIVGVIQTAIGMLMIISPTFKELVDSQRHQFWEDSYIGLSSWRMFGLSDNLLHITPIVQAVIAFFILLRSSKHIWLSLLIPPFFMLCAVNTRTSAVIFIILSILYFVFAPNLRRKNYVFLILLAVTIFTASSLLLFMETNAEGGYEYFVTGYEAVMDFSSGDTSDSSVAFSSGYNSFPDDLSTLIIGTGHGIQGGLKYNGHNFSGDMGFINDIWRYGILLSLVLWGAFIWQAKSINNLELENSRLVSIAMIVVFLLSQFKGTTIFYCDYVVLLYLLSCAGALDKNNVQRFLGKNRKLVQYGNV